MMVSVMKRRREERGMRVSVMKMMILIWMKNVWSPDLKTMTRESEDKQQQTHTHTRRTDNQTQRQTDRHTDIDTYRYKNTHIVISHILAHTDAQSFSFSYAHTQICPTKKKF